MLFYRRRLDDNRCPVICGRRVIPDDYIPAIIQALRDQGILPSQEAPSMTRHEDVPLIGDPPHVWEQRSSRELTDEDLPRDQRNASSVARES